MALHLDSGGVTVKGVGFRGNDGGGLPELGRGSRPGCGGDEEPAEARAERASLLW